MFVAFDLKIFVIGSVPIGLRNQKDIKNKHYNSLACSVYIQYTHIKHLKLFEMKTLTHMEVYELLSFHLLKKKPIGYRNILNAKNY